MVTEVTGKKLKPVLMRRFRVPSWKEGQKEKRGLFVIYLLL